GGTMRRTTFFDGRESVLKMHEIEISRGGIIRIVTLEDIASASARPRDESLRTCECLRTSWRSFGLPDGLRAWKRSATLYIVEYIADRGWREAARVPMTLSSAHGPLQAASLDLNGVRVLVVEDCWHVGIAVKNLLQACGADVAGPVATTAAAESLISKQTPNVALVDFSLRGGERADVLIDQLHDRGVRVIVIPGLP